MAYEKDYRKRILNFYYENGKTKTLFHFNISSSTLYGWIKPKKETGDLSSRTRKRKFKVLDPEKLDENAVKGIDPNLLTDPFGILINEEKSDYRYEPTSCENGKCKKFSLRTKLEKESDFVRRSKN